MKLNLCEDDAALELLRGLAGAGSERRFEDTGEGGACTSRWLAGGARVEIVGLRGELDGVEVRGRGGRDWSFWCFYMDVQCIRIHEDSF